jgi:hypothetical protein
MKRSSITSLIGLLTTLVVCAMGASSASAEQGYFSAAEYPAHATGGNISGKVNALTAGELSLECGVTYTGILEEQSSTLTVTPSYSGCKVGERSATVTTNGCTYRLHMGEGAEDSYPGTFDIVCPEGKQLEVHVYEGESTWCSFRLPGQNARTGLTFTRETEAAAVSVENKVEAITGTLQGKCTSGFDVNFENGVLDLNATISLKPLEVQGRLTSVSYPQHFSGEDAKGEFFTLAFESIKCKVAYTGQINQSTTEITIVPSYSNCLRAEKEPVTVTMNGCSYVFKIGLGRKDTWNTSMNVTCPGENRIEIHTYANEANHKAFTSNCTLTIAQQMVATGPITFTNETASEDIRLEKELFGAGSLGAQRHGSCAPSNTSTTMFFSLNVTLANSGGSPLHVGQ